MYRKFNVVHPRIEILNLFENFYDVALHYQLSSDSKTGAVLHEKSVHEYVSVHIQLKWVLWHVHFML